MMFAQSINVALQEEMQRDADVIMVGEDIGHYRGVVGVMRGLQEEFGPERVRDAPLCEAAIVGFCVGRAVADLEFMDFVIFAMDPIVNQADKLRYFWGRQVSVPRVVRPRWSLTYALAAGTRRVWRRGLGMCPACASPCSQRLRHQGADQDRDP